MGWASWRRVWPEGKGGGGIVPICSGCPFVVSDVNVTNIPKVDCTRALGAGGGCGKWTQFDPEHMRCITRSRIPHGPGRAEMVVLQARDIHVAAAA